MITSMDSTVLKVNMLILFYLFWKKTHPIQFEQKKKLCHHLLSKSYKHFYIFDFQYKSCVRVALYTKKKSSQYWQMNVVKWKIL